MNTFALKVFLFIIPLFLIASFLEEAVRQIPNPYKLKYNWMQENANNLNTLILGSSHAYYGISPKELDYKVWGTSFNIANCGQIYTFDLYLLKYWDKKYMHLENVICPVSYFSLFIDDMDLSYAKNYKLYMDCDLYSDCSQCNFEMSEPKTTLSKYINFINNKNDMCDELGWKAAKLEDKDMVRWNTGFNMAINHTASTRNFQGVRYKELCEIAEYCKQNLIRLILVTTPCYHTYYDKLDTIQLHDMYAMINSIVTNYHVEYKDYLKDCRFEANDFNDSDHLSDIGATKFSQILNIDFRKTQQ